ncbi:hypothetical protein [Anabaena catenula]|uniref:Uncharacterized protein n=1 Tax=Anabaena catenula FACHB-362 TaxID=2692877 RepID=A0ABR8J4X0_9NOST|nr:hypothetical protein [Anabaena catenula]MBD2693407.1 hypothetical protein [Anabaena catenula FACHB-362]
MNICLETGIHLSTLLDFVKTFFIIIGGVLAFASYKGQHQQRAIDNSLKSLERFEKSIQKEDLEIWEVICYRAYESGGAKPGHFVIYSKEDESSQIPLYNLFIPEGQGLCIPESKLNLDDQSSNLELGSVRRITEQLNLISYEILYGNVELRIIYQELGQIMATIFQWIDEIEDKDTKLSTQSMFPHFIKMYRKRQGIIKNLPSRPYVNFC